MLFVSLRRGSTAARVCRGNTIESRIAGAYKRVKNLADGHPGQEPLELTWPVAYACTHNAFAPGFRNMKCPKCEFEQSDTNLECLRCGVIFSKLGMDAPRPDSLTGAGARQTKHDQPMSPIGGYEESASHYRQPADTPVRATTAGSPIDPGPQGQADPVPDSRSAGYGNGRGLSESVAGAVAGLETVAGRSEARGILRPEDEPDLPFEPAHDEIDSEVEPEPRHMDRTDWMFLGIGLAIAVGVKAFPLLNHIFMTMTTLVHELGHTIFGWLFGYPSLPAFDLRYGGGVTMSMQRSIALLILFYGLCAGLIYTYRRNTVTLVFLLTLVIVHAVCTYTSMHDVIILFMGHGTELAIAGIFIYRALSGAAVVHTAERPLYAAVGLFIVISDTIFSYRLVTSVRARDLYEQAKGGGHWMDFSRIAEDYLHVDLTAVALFFFLCCLIPPILGFLAFRYQEYLRKLVTHMWAREPV
jgi:hypothetical protein